MRAAAEHFFLFLHPPDLSPKPGVSQAPDLFLKDPDLVLKHPERWASAPDLWWTVSAAPKEFDQVRRLVATSGQSITQREAVPPEPVVKAVEAYVDRLRKTGWRKRLAGFWDALAQYKDARSHFARLAKRGASPYWMAALIAQRLGLKHRTSGLLLAGRERPTASKDALVEARREAKKLAGRLEALADKYKAFHKQLRDLLRENFERTVSGTTVSDLLRAEGQWLAAENSPVNRSPGAMGRLLNPKKRSSVGGNFALRFSGHVLLTTGFPHDPQVAKLLNALKIQVGRKEVRRKEVTAKGLEQLRRRRKISEKSVQQTFHDDAHHWLGDIPLFALLEEFQDDARFTAAVQATPAERNTAVIKAFKQFQTPRFTYEAEDVGRILLVMRRSLF